MGGRSGAAGGEGRVSAEALLWAVDQRTGDALARFVLLILAGAADEWGEVEATPAELAQWTEATRWQLQRALTHLRRGRWIETGDQPGRMRLRMERE
jgi:hypothetical protein